MKRIKGEKCNLTNLNLGQSAKIIDIQLENKEVKRRLMELGLVKGTKVKIKKIAPLGEPVVIEFRGFEMFLGKKELKRIYVEVL